MTYLGLLQPLSLLEGIWRNITIDFIESLPKSKGKDTIMVVVDRFINYTYFIALIHHFPA
jgi:hypothetical protein